MSLDISPIPEKSEEQSTFGRRLDWCRQNLAHFAEYHDAVLRKEIDEAENKARFQGRRAA